MLFWSIAIPRILPAIIPSYSFLKGSNPLNYRSQSMVWETLSIVW